MRGRQQVIELLLCAADLGMTTKDAGIAEAAIRIGCSRRTHRLAVQARIRADLSMQRLESYEDTCLEAAARVEEGSWP